MSDEGDDSEVVRGPVAVLSDSTRRVIELLDKLDIGDLATWEQMKEVIPRETDLSGVRATWRSAAKRLQRDKLKHFRVVKGHGVKRITHDEMIEEDAPRRLGRVRRAAKRTHDSIRRVDLMGMKPENRLMAAGYAAATKATQQALTQKAVNRLAQGSEDGKKIPTLAETFQRLHDALRKKT